MDHYLQYQYYKFQSSHRIMIGILLLFGTFQNSYAENTIYGSLNYDYQSSHTQQNKKELDTNYYPHKSPYKNAQYRSHSNINNSESYIGIKGKKDIGNGNAIIYQFELSPKK